MLKKGADPNVTLSNGETPLTTASYRGKNDVVAMLLKRGGNPRHITKTGNSAFYYAALANNTGTMQILFSTVDGDQLARSFVKIVKANNLQMIDLCLTRKFNVDYVGYQGETALQESVWRGKLSLTDTLVKRGADVNRADPWGNTPLMLATKKGNESVLSLLVQKGANIDFGTTAEFTPLGRAIELKNTKAIEILLRNGAEIRDNHIRLARKVGDLSVLKLLGNQ